MAKKVVQFMDTSFRDGFQSVFGARVATADFLPALEAAVAAGIRHFEAGGGARFQSLFFYCNESAFAMMDTFRKTVGPEADLQTLARGINVVGLRQQPRSMIDLHAKLFKQHGITTIRNFDALNDLRNLKYSGERIAAHGLHHQICITLVDLPPELVRRSMVIKKAERLDIECVVRNYIAGSAWAEYEESGTMNGQTLPAGIKAADRFAEPIFTPSPKAASGHDMALTPQEAEDLVGVEMHRILEEKSLELFQVAHDYAEKRRMILVDTKFEFGFVDGELTIIDEVLTPDSSRYWDVNDWEPGNFPPAFDKQFLRAWLLDTDWKREPPPPELPDSIIEQTQARYLESYRRLSGKSLVL